MYEKCNLDFTLHKENRFTVSASSIEFSLRPQSQNVNMDQKEAAVLQAKKEFQLCGSTETISFT